MNRRPENGLLSNFISLSALQAINIAAPLIVMPYLVRVLGIAKFGELSFVLSMIMLLNILVSFGFEVSTLRLVPISRDDRGELSRLVCSVVSAKLLLLGLTFLVLSLTIAISNLASDEKLLYLLTFGIVVGNCIFPIWLFQGMEDFKIATYLVATTRVLSTGTIFLLVQNGDDWLLVPAINSVMMIAIGLISLAIAKRRYELSIFIPTSASISGQLKDSFPFFLSRIANDGSRHYAIVVIGTVFDSTILGLYAIVEKLVYAFLSLGGVASQVIYPYMCRTKDLAIVRKAIRLVFLISFVSFLLATIVGASFFELAFEVTDERLQSLFLIGLGGALFGNISTLLGYPLLGAFGFSSHANRSLVYAAIIYVCYITIAAFVIKNIYYTAFGLPVYLISGLILRLVYVHSERDTITE